MTNWRWHWGTPHQNNFSENYYFLILKFLNCILILLYNSYALLIGGAAPVPASTPASATKVPAPTGKATAATPAAKADEFDDLFGEEEEDPGMII